MNVELRMKNVEFRMPCRAADVHRATAIVTINSRTSTQTGINDEC